MTELTEGQIATELIAEHELREKDTAALLAKFIVNVNFAIKHGPLAERESMKLGMVLEEFHKLIEALGLDPTASGDEIEMAVYAALKASVVRREAYLTKLFKKE